MKILIIAAVLGIFAIGLSFYKGSSVFAEQQADVARVVADLDIAEGELSDAEEQVAQARGDLDSAKRTLAESELELESLANRTGALQASRRSIEAQINQLAEEEAQAKQAIAQIDELLQEAGISTAGGIEVDQIQDSIAQLEQEMGNRRGELEQLESRLAGLESQAASRQDQLDSMRQARTERLRSLDLNSWSGSVTDVDNEWGVVVFRGGSAVGLDPQAQYIVTRNGERVASLEVVSMDANRTLANVSSESTEAGDLIQPGDTVILVEPNTGR